MGKLVGGTGQLNNLIYVRGHPDDFKSWYASNQEFDYERDILPYFKKIEHFQGIVIFKLLLFKILIPVLDSPSNGVLTNLIYTSIIPKFILEGFKELGYSIGNNILDTFSCKKL